MCGPQTKRRRGFTLAEILVVVVILGIASAIVVPKLATRDDLALSAAARTLTADLMYAQNLAISTQAMHVVRFDVANNKYTVLKYTSPSTETTLTHPLTQQSYVVQYGPTSSQSKSLVLSTVTLNGLDSQYQSMSAVGFDELGTPYVYDASKSTRSNEMVTGSILLQSGSFSMTVSIDRYTGEIRVQ